MIQILHPHAEPIINTGFVTELWSDDNQFTEGPVWVPEGYFLYSDIPENRICRIDGPGKRTVYLRDSGCTLEDRSYLSQQVGSNGLALDALGNLYICQHGNGAVARYADGQMETLLSGSNGRPFNSPNDIVVHPGGAVFFSDPPYGLKDQQLRPDLRQEGAAFWCWRDGVLTAFCKEYRFPNGLCLSPDGATLYVCSSKAFERKLLAYNVATLEFKGLVAEENCDGLKCDINGNLWLCTREGLVLLNPEGTRLAVIPLEKEPANCCWGGSEGKDLFVTAREHTYYLRGIRK